MFRYKRKQRLIARAIVRGAPGWAAWAASRGIVSRELTRDETNQAIEDLNLRLELMGKLRRANLLPIWDMSVQAWVPLTYPVKPAPVAAAKESDEEALFDIIAEQEDRLIKQDAKIAALEARFRKIEIATGLEAGDPHELDEVGAQKSHVREQYDAFDKEFNPTH